MTYRSLFFSDDILPILYKSLGPFVTILIQQCRQLCETKARKSTFFVPKYPKRNISQITTEKLRKTDFYKSYILRSFYKSLGPFGTICIKQYQNRVNLGH